MRTLLEVAEAYQEAVGQIKDIVKALPYKVLYVMEQLGLERSQFYARLKGQNWEPQHMMVFARLQQQAQADSSRNS